MGCPTYSSVGSLLMVKHIAQASFSEGSNLSGCNGCNESLEIVPRVCLQPPCQHWRWEHACRAKIGAVISECRVPYNIEAFRFHSVNISLYLAIIEGTPRSFSELELSRGTVHITIVLAMPLKEVLGRRTYWYKARVLAFAPHGLPVALSG